MKISHVLLLFFRDFIALMFPRVCINCQSTLVQQENYLCLKCRLSLPKTNYHLWSDNPLNDKFVYEPKIQTVATYLFFNKGGIAQKLIHEVKYKNQPELGIWLGELYGRELQKMNWPIDMIVPIPLHQSKLARRGFNQSEQMAQGISRETGWPVNSESVIRKRSTSTQTKKSKLERWQNVQSIYSLVNSGAFTGKIIAVVDDVLTTGATIGELILLLSKSGVKGIYILTIAAGK